MKHNYQTANYHIEIGMAGDTPTEPRGFFERDDGEVVGGLWFHGKSLVDYDGVFTLPRQVFNCLRENGYEVPEDCV